MEAKEFVPYLSDNIFEERSYLAGKQAGIKEVVEWIKEHKLYAGNISIPKNALEKKLKEWGI